VGSSKEMHAIDLLRRVLGPNKDEIIKGLERTAEGGDS
jgi:hypothetical protein